MLTGLDDDEFKSGPDTLITTERSLCVELADGKQLCMTERMAAQSGLFRQAIECEDDDTEVKLDLVSPPTMTFIMDYMQHHLDASTLPPIPKPLPESGLEGVVDAWDYKFVESMDLTAVINVICAASYLDVAPLLELASAAMASRIRGKTPAEIRVMFGVTEEYTDEMKQATYKKFQDLIES